MTEVEDGVIWKRYADQLLQADTRQSERENSDFDSLSATSTAESTQASTDTDDLGLTPDDTNSGGSQTNTESSYPQQVHHSPVRYY